MGDSSADVKALPTRYGSTVYRSRLEARWALFFEYLRIPFVYEPEGFDLPSGRYLPDFWLPVIRTYFEVKGQEPTGLEGRLAWELHQATGERVVVAWGGLPQRPDEYGWEDGTEPGAALRPKWRDIWLNGAQDFDYAWCRCTVCGIYGIEHEGKSPRICNHEGWGDKHPRTANDDGIVHAYSVANGYRFWPGRR